jgi:hypothetical protein
VSRLGGSFHWRRLPLAEALRATFKTEITLDDRARAVALGLQLDVPEFPGKYPSGDMFGELPALGLYSRHVDGLTLKISVSTMRPSGSAPGKYCGVRTKQLARQTLRVRFQIPIMARVSPKRERLSSNVSIRSDPAVPIFAARQHSCAGHSS